MAMRTAMVVRNPLCLVLAAIFSLSLICTYVAAQQRTGLPRDTLALVGQKPVTGVDLLERIELMPWPGKDRPAGMDSTKIEALRSLVAERILAFESADEGIIPDSVMRRHLRYIEKLMVRDELYKREVAAGISVGNEEVRQGLARFAREVIILMIGVGDRARAEAVSDALLRGDSLDSVLARGSGGPSVTVDTVRVTFGLLQRHQEDVVYSLNASRRASAPLDVEPLGWVVFYEIGDQTDPAYAKLSITERVQTVKRRIHRRKELERGNEFENRELSRRKAEAVRDEFKLFADTLRSIIVADSGNERVERGYMVARAAENAAYTLRARLENPLIEFSDGRLTVGDVLEALRNADFAVPSLRPGEFFPALNGILREISAREFLAREGYRRHLDRTEEVRHDVDMWETSWNARALMERLTADVTVTDEDIIDALIRRSAMIGRDYRVNVREILSDSVSRSLFLMEKVIAGGDMRALAMENSIRREWAVRGGESGYFFVGEHPEIGIRALDATPGSLVGPVKLPEGYSFFMVLGKEAIPRSNALPYDSLKRAMRVELLRGKTDKRLNKLVASAAQKYDVKLYYDRLKKVEIDPINIVTKRFIGFGGTMMAAPTLYPLWQWVGETEDVQQVFP